jgi:hypothetical protein
MVHGPKEKEREREEMGQLWKRERGEGRGIFFFF